MYLKGATDDGHVAYLRLLNRPNRTSHGSTVMKKSRYGVSRQEATRAIDFVISGLNPGDRLPSVRNLAQQLGASKSTIQRTIQEKVETGELRTTAGSGVFLPGNDLPKEIPAVVRKTVSENIADELYRLIREGFYMLGESLPQVKRIAIQYGVSPNSVVAAYRILCRRGDVTKVGKRYIVGPFAGGLEPLEHGDVVLFDSDPESFRSMVQKSPLSGVLQSMELFLLRRGITLRYALLESFQETCDMWCNSGTVPAGLVFHGVNQEKYEQIQPSIKHLRSRTPDNRPPVLLFCKEPIRKKLSKIFLASEGNMNTTFYRKVARFVCEGKYSNVRYFVNGTKSKKSFPYYLKFRTELKHLEPDMPLRIYFIPGNNGLDLERILIRSGEKKAELHNPILDKYTHTSVQTIRNEITVVNEFLPSQDIPAKKSLWIFSHDDDAARALDWAHENGIEVPETLSIMGLTNDPRFFHRGITSAIRDSQTTGYLCAHALIGDFPVARTTKGFIRPEAHVLKRLTTH